MDDVGCCPWCGSLAGDEEVYGEGELCGPADTEEKWGLIAQRAGKGWESAVPWRASPPSSKASPGLTAPSLLVALVALPGLGVGGRGPKGIFGSADNTV